MKMSKPITVIIDGVSGAGKTNFFSTVYSGKFEPEYYKTNGFSEASVRIYTNHGWVKFILCDMPTTDFREEYGEYMKKIYNSANALIFMTETTINSGCVKVKNMISEIRERKVPPIVAICVNKADTDPRKLKTARIEKQKKEDFCFGDVPSEMFMISTKSRYNLYEPLLYIARKHMGYTDLVLAPEPAPEEPCKCEECERELKYTLEEMQKRERELSEQEEDIKEMMHRLKGLNALAEELKEMERVNSVVRDNMED